MKTDHPCSVAGRIPETVLTLLAVVALCVVRSAGAQQTFKYTGAPFSYVGTSDFYGAPVTAISGHFTVASALAPGTSYLLTPDTIGGTITDYSFTDGRYTADIHNYVATSPFVSGPFSTPVFAVTTGSDGNIKSWYLNILSPTAWIYSRNSADYDSFYGVTVADGVLADPAQAYDAYNSNNPGTWSGDQTPKIKPTALRIVAYGVEISYVISGGDLSDFPFVDLYWDAGDPPSPTTPSVQAAHVQLSNKAMSAPATPYTETLMRSTFIVPTPPAQKPPHTTLSHVRAVISAQNADLSNNSLSARMTITVPQLGSYTAYHAKRGPDSPEFQDSQFLQDLIDQSLLNNFDPRFILAIAGKETTYGRDSTIDLPHFDAGQPNPTDQLTAQQLRGIHNYWNVIKKRSDFTTPIGLCSESEWAGRPNDCQWLASDNLSSLTVFKIFPSISAAAEDRCVIMGSPSGSYHGYKTITQIAPIYDPKAPAAWMEGVRAIIANLSWPNADDISVTGGDANYFGKYKVFFQVFSPVALLLLDPEGRSVGSFNRATQTMNQIPGSVVETNGTQTEGIWLPNFTSGEYKLFLYGTGDGSFTVDFAFIHPSADFSGTTVEGQIALGETQVLIINVDTNNPDQTTVTQVLPPACNVRGPYTAECNGAFTMLTLNGAGSSDPNGTPIAFFWTSDCPAATFDNPTSPTPTLILSSSSVPETCNVTLTVSNSFGLSSTCGTPVTVKDTLPPNIGPVTATPAVLWPPNHKFVDVFVDYMATDQCDSNPSSSLAVANNEPINGVGDGNTSSDWEIVDSHHLRLRAERSGTGSGRVYTITATSTDSSGNSSSKAVTVTVPKSHGK